MVRVVVKKGAEKFIFKADKKMSAKIIEVLKYLESDPIPFKAYDVVKLKGYGSRFRIRVGRIRIVYEFNPEELAVVVWDIDFRGSIY